MKLRASRLIWRTLIAVAAGATVVLVSASAAGARKPPGGGGGGFSTTSTYAKSYANIVNGTQYELTPEDVQATPDGGWIALALTKATTGLGVSWLLKASATGAPQWQEEI